MGHETLYADGAFSFDGGVDSSKAVSIRSDLTPRGLARNQLAWLRNGTVRSGAITQRTGWTRLGTVHDATGLYQGGFMYQPTDNITMPYLMLSISGVIYRYIIDTGTVTEVTNDGPLLGTPRPYSATNPQFNPATADQAYFAQAEEFLIIQAGDGTTLPYFYDGVRMWRSLGITDPAIGAPAPNVNEIPAATCMCYHQRRLWFARGHNYAAGDIVYGTAGTAMYAARDAVLNVTEAPLCFGSDGFTVPANIRCLTFAPTLNTALGEGNLYISTRKGIYALDVPVTRTNWIATDTDEIPAQTVVQLGNGWVNDRSVVAVNGDLFGQSLEPGIRSLNVSVKNARDWANVPLSSSVNRALAYNDRNLMRFATGIYFDNRLWQAIRPTQLPQGVVHQGVLALDFTTVSSFETVTTDSPDTPAWEGMHEGLNILQLFTGDFGGRERAFAVVVSALDGSIEIWELTTDQRRDNVDSRVHWGFETPAYTFNSEREMKQLQGGELWLSKVSGTVGLDVYYRTDADPCWRFWYHTSVCAARNCEEDSTAASCYPADGNGYREGYRWPIVLPKPKGPEDAMGVRPTTDGYQFQLKIDIVGWCQIRGLVIYASKIDRDIYRGLNSEAP